MAFTQKIAIPVLVQAQLYLQKKLREVGEEVVRLRVENDALKAGGSAAPEPNAVQWKSLVACIACRCNAYVL